MLLKKEEVIKMFQNLTETENTKETLANPKNILANVLSKKYIILYIVTFMLSQVSMGYDISPFSIAIIAAGVSNEIPIIGVILVSLIGNTISTGFKGTVSFIIILLLFFASFLIKEPKYNDPERNEKLLLSRRIFFASIIVSLIKVFINQVLIYDILTAMCMSIIIVIFYKVFSNSLSVITNYNEKMAFSIEEVLGASLLCSIALCALGEFSVFGFCVRNILSIFIVLVLGWKHGVLIGTTAGVTIGVTLGIIANSEPVVVAAFAISGMIAGVLNKFGKIGVICGFVLGNIVLSYVASGLVFNVILLKEILIAGIALLAVPKNVNLNIESMLGDKKLLPLIRNRRLNNSTDTINKLNNISGALKDMVNTYKKAAATTITEEDIREKNKQQFIIEFLNTTEHLESNILYDITQDVEGKIVDDIFNYLLENQFIKERDLINILAKNNNYVVGFDEDEKKKNYDIEKMVNAINSAFRLSKMNFIWSKKLDEEKKNFETQLNGVSKAISEIAENIDKENKSEDLFDDKKEQIVLLLKQKNIIVQEISLTKKENDRYRVSLYIDNQDGENKGKTITNIINKVLEEKMIIQEREVIENENIIKYDIISDDKFLLDIGISQYTKDGMSVSGDSTIKMKLKDGKYLLAISDGMGSGPEAKKSSQIVTKMLKRLLNSGFERDTSVELINSNLLNVADDVFATLDIAIIDLYKGNIEFIKNGACPTYIKNSKKVQIIKSLTLPTGVVNQINTDVFDKDIDSNDIVVMISDGIMDSNIEYKNKELWVKYFLEDMETTNPQKIADIILKESIDNNFGKVKDDMSIIVCKFIKK
ncbi:MAG TPA: hypothetical protein DEP51_04565 [Clostridiales bacterium]|nr:hypothetical protein [Clostridiales bacterium]